MGTTGPIKDIEELNRIKEYLRKQNFRNYLIFRIGINFGIPIDQLLQLKIEDVANKKTFIYGEYQLSISESLQKDIAFYVKNRNEGYLFSIYNGKPLSRFQLYNILNEAARTTGYGRIIGVTTIRKTFAYWAYKKWRSHLPLLSEYLNHRTNNYTLKYIGINSDIPVEGKIFPEVDI